MKKVGFGIVASCLVALTLTACSNGNSAGDTSSSGGKKIIVYATRFANDTLEANIKKYEALHPNIEIKLDIAPPMTQPISPQTILDNRKKYYTALDTAMLAGKGPDMLEMDPMPLKYTNHDLLVDLGKMMDQDATFKKEDYFSNILDNSKDGKGRLTSMPLNFGLVSFIGNQDAIAETGVKFNDNTWTWNDFLNITKQLIAAKGKYSSVLSDAPVMVMRAIVDANPSLIIDVPAKKARFDSPEFRELLNQIKTLKDEGVFGVGGGAESYFANSFTPNDPWDYIELANVYNPNGKFYTYPHPEGKQGGNFSTRHNVAITTSSKVKPEAWDFLKFMMSEQANAAPIRENSEGVPINKQGLANQLNKLTSDGTFKQQAFLYGEEGGSVTVDTAKLDEFENRVNKAILHYVPDEFIDNLVFDEFIAFFAGQKSMDAVVKVLQDKVTTYLNE